MSKYVIAAFILVGLAGCSSTPSGMVDSPAPSYGYRSLGGNLDATRPEGQTIRLVYGGQRYQNTPEAVAELRRELDARAEAYRMRDLMSPTGPTMWDELKIRWAYETDLRRGKKALAALDGQPIPVVAISGDPAKPCTIELPPPRNSADADFFRALGEASFACMQGNWR
jgi:hypothetical protein